MKCAICLMVKEGEAFDALTVRGGTAVCEHHMGYANDAHVSNVFRTLPISGGVITYQKDEDFSND